MEDGRERGVGKRGREVGRERECVFGEQNGY